MGAYSYGDTEIEHESLTLICTQLIGPQIELPKGSKKEPPFDIVESVFAPRRVTNDSKTFYDDEQVTRRAFEIDFARCNQERFRLLIRSEDDDTGDGGEGTGSE